MKLSKIFITLLLAIIVISSKSFAMYNNKIATISNKSAGIPSILQSKNKSLLILHERAFLYGTHKSREELLSFARNHLPKHDIIFSDELNVRHKYIDVSNITVLKNRHYSLISIINVHQDFYGRNQGSVAYTNTFSADGTQIISHKTLAHKSKKSTTEGENKVSFQSAIKNLSELEQNNSLQLQQSTIEKSIYHFSGQNKLFDKLIFVMFGYEPDGFKSNANYSHEEIIQHIPDDFDFWSLILKSVDGSTRFPWKANEELTKSIVNFLPVTKVRHNDIGRAILIAGLKFENPEIVYTMLDKVDPIFTADPRTVTKMFQLADMNSIPSIIDPLLKYKIDLKITSKKEGFALMHYSALKAAKTGDFYFVDKLLSINADMNVFNRQGNTPLTNSLAHYPQSGMNKVQYVKELLKRGADLNTASTALPANLPLNLAINSGDSELVKLMLNSGADINNNYPDIQPALSVAFTKENPELIIDLLNQGADPHGGKGAKIPPIIAAYNANYTEVTSKLIEKGADFDAKDDAGKTLLHYAAASGDKGVIDALIASGADILAKDRDKNSALYYAYPHPSLEFDDNRRAIIATLEAAGLDPDKKNLFGYTPADNYKLGRESWGREQQIRKMEELTQRQELNYKRQQLAAQELARAQAESQRRIAQERQMRAQAAEKETGFNWGKALAMGAGFAIGGIAEMDTQTQADIIGGIIIDSMPGVEGISNTQSAVNGMQQRYAANSTANPYTSSNNNAANHNLNSTPAKQNYLAQRGASGCSSDPNVQLNSICRTADVYYNRYLQVRQEQGDLAARQMYEIHVVTAKQALRFKESSKVLTGIDLSPSSNNARAPIAKQIRNQSSGLDCNGQPIGAAKKSSGGGSGSCRE